MGLQGEKRHVQMAEKTKADFPGSPYWSGLDLARAPPGHTVGLTLWRPGLCLLPSGGELEGL